MKKKNGKRVHFRKILPLLGQLLRDLKPVPERLNLKVDVQEISKERILNYCSAEKDEIVYKKMAEHELIHEPVEGIIALKQQNGEKIEKKYFNKILSDLGYNVYVLFSKNHGCDYDAAVNVNGYYLPGWNLFIKFLRKLNSNLSVFLGKRFAPGCSRLHIRIFEGRNTWYVIAHADKFNWINLNFLGVMKSHVGSGQGDYKNGTKYFLESIKYYFKD